MTEIAIEGVRSIQEAVINLDAPIILIAGDNGEGKTSILLALKACLTGTTACFTTKSKDDAPGMLAEGRKEQAFAILRNDDGEHKTARWAKGKCHPVRSSKTVAGLPHATTAAAGLPDFLSMEPKARAQMFLDVFQVEPTKDDLKKAVAQAELDVDVEDLWKAKTVQGWDNAGREQLEKATQLKANWRAITGETWGEDVADGWQPDCLNETSMPLEKLEALGRLHEAAKEKAAEARSRREAIVIPPAPAEKQCCPHCSKPVSIRNGNQVVRYEEGNPQERERLIAARRAMEGEISGLEEDERNAHADLVSAQALAKRAEEDREGRIEEAAELDGDIRRTLKIADLFGMDGVRATKRDRQLHLVTSELQALGEILGMDDLRLVWEPEPGRQIHTICARLGDRNYHHLSNSEKWRARLLIQIVIARRDGSQMILIDDCDVLVRHHRGPLVKLFKETGIQVVAAMAVENKPSEAPDFKKAGIGETYWVENGQVLPLGQAVAAISQAA